MFFYFLPFPRKTYANIIFCLLTVSLYEYVNPIGRPKADGGGFAELIPINSTG